MEHVRCNLCGADETAVRFASTVEETGSARAWESFRCTHDGYGRHHRIVTCVRCGLGYADPRPSAQDILGSYSQVEDPLYVQELDGRLLTFERHLDSLERHRKPPGRMLDVGAYTGAFVEVARRRGWDVEGLEPSAWAVAEAEKRGLRVHKGSLDDVRLPAASFDVVTMWDVIEHLSDPARALAESFRLLSPGGLLAVHTMDAGSAFARLAGARWPWLMEMHLYYYSKKTLEAALRQAGFEVLRTRAHGRYLRLGYLASRLGGLLGATAGRVSARVFETLRLSAVPVPLNMGDLVTSFAVKPQASRLRDDEVERPQRDRAASGPQDHADLVTAGRT